MALFVRTPVAFTLLCLLLLGLASEAHADAQVSIRHALGVGKRDEAGTSDDEIIVDLSMRADALYGKPERGSYRIGPAFEGRITDFYTLEMALGGSAILPVINEDFPFGIMALLGYGMRLKAPDGPSGILVGTFGYRGYNYHGWYGWAIQGFVRASKNLGGETKDDIFEVTGGIEIDATFTTVIPFMFFRNLITGKDPHEDE